MTHASRPIAPLDFLQLIGVALIWGVNNVLARVALLDLPPFLVVAVRFAIVLALIGWRIRPIPRDKWPAFALMLCCVGPVHFGIQFVGLSLAHDLAPMVVAMQLWAPASVLFAMALLGEHASRLRLAGVAVAFLGVAGMAFDPIVFSQWGALALVATASCAYGLGAVIVRWMGQATDVWSMQGWIALACTPSMIAATALFEPNAVQAAQAAPWFVWVAIAFAGVVSSIGANAMLFNLVQRYEVSRTTPYLLATPVISFALAGVWLGDHITLRILLGAAITMSGVGLVALAERRFRSVTPAVAALSDQ